MHGGVATGVAQALYESYVYDDDGNPLTGTFVGYAFPSAADLPSWEAVEMETPTPAERARREGNRRVGDDRRDAGRPQRRRRRARAVRRAQRRSARQRRERLARPPGGEGMTRIALTVNGSRHEADVEPRQLLAYFLRDELGPEGDERRLRHQLVRGVHGAARRRVGQVVHGLRGAGRRLRGDDGRGPRARRRAASGAAGVPRAARPAVRLSARPGS